jgi:outer membrane protein
MRTIIFFLMLCISANIARGQHRTISLAESRKAALAYSNSIKNGQINVSAAEAGLKAAKANQLPGISGTGLGVYGFKDIIPPIPDVLNKGINNIYSIGLTGTQNIYAGRKVITNNRLAELQVQANKILARQSVDSVLLLTEQKYWTIVNLQEQQKTILANETLLKGVLKLQQDMLASGLIARNDLLKAKVQLSQLLVTKSKLSNNKMLALFDFSVYTGLPYDSLMVMKDTLNKNSIPALLAATADTTLTGLNNYQLLELNVKSNALQTRLEKGNNLPSLSVGISASQAGSFNGAFKSSFMPLGFGTLSIPISENIWGGNRQKIKQRRLNEQIARNNFSDGRNQLQVNILKYWYDLKDALTQINYARESLDQATENLKVNQDNYKVGLNNVSDVLDAQAAYQQAETTLNTAYTDLETKRANYRFATGKINEN